MNAHVRARGVAKAFRVHRYRRSVLRALRGAFDPAASQARWVLRDVSFDVAPGEKVALVGRNGSGKTTLLRLLAGIYTPTDGTLEVGVTPVALFNAGIGFIKDLSVLDNIFLCGAIYGMPRRVLRGRIDAILAAAGVPHLEHAPFKDLSSGQAQRLGLSIFFQSDRPLMVFDEALTNVDRVFAAHADRYFQALAASPTTVLMTSHDGAFLVRHCRRAIWLEAGRVRADGPAAEIVAGYEAACRDAASAPR